MKHRRCRRALVPARATALLWLAFVGSGCEHPGAVLPPPAAPVRRVATPLPLPDDLLLAGRWLHPKALLKQLQSWAGGDLTPELWLRGRVGRPSRPIDLEAPIEFFAL